MSPREMYQKMLLIRLFEERVLDLFSMGKLHGTTHAYIGQEANAVGILSNVHENDKVFSSHRCHGHYLAKTDDLEGLLAELMGKENGVCGGLGGSQHICHRNFFSNGVQGSYMPIVVGMAYAEKVRETQNIVVCFIGDGTLGEGATYEAMNMMSLYQVPVLLIIENNGYAQTTPVSIHLAGDLANRPRAFGIDTAELNTTDVEVVSEYAKGVIPAMRRDGRPRAVVIHTYRLCPHSKGDDTRSKEEVDAIRQFDPLRFSCDLQAAEIEQMRQAIMKRIAAAEELAAAAGFKKWPNP